MNIKRAMMALVVGVMMTCVFYAVIMVLVVLGSLASFLISIIPPLLHLVTPLAITVTVAVIGYRDKDWNGRLAE